MRPAATLFLTVCTLVLSLLGALATDPPDGDNPQNPSQLPEEILEGYWYIGDRVQVDTIMVQPDLRLMESWEADLPAVPAWRPSEPRYFVRRWTSDTTSWISPNSLTSSIPYPPSSRGPRACGCLNRNQQPEAIYAEMEHCRQWAWLPDWFDSAHPARPFAPNIWNGMGPCPRLGMSSVLHRLPAYVVDEEEEGWHRLVDEARRDMQAQESMDEAVLAALFPEAAREALPRIERLIYRGAAHLSLLHARWASWVYSLLTRRAFVIFEIISRYAHQVLTLRFPGMLERLNSHRYFGAAPMGAWFDDTIEHAGLIRQYILWGIPVYYRWEDGYNALPFLADLAPHRPPGPSAITFRAPPLTPKRVKKSDPLPSANRHWNTLRSPPASMITSPEESAFCSDEVIHQIQNLDPYHLPDEGPRPLSPEIRGFGDDNDSMTLDSQFSSTLDPSMLSDFGSPSLQAVDQGLVTPRRRSSSPPPPPSLLLRLQMPLADRIRPPTAVNEQQLPSIFDFFNNPPRHRRSFAPVPIFERNDWHFHLEEANARVRERVQDLVDSGALANNEALIRFAVRHRMGFLTIAPRIRDADAEPPRGGPETFHDVAPSMRILPGTLPSQRVDRWARGVREVLSRPHARAAITQGGLTARLAEWAGLTVDHALAGPTRAARVFGGPRTYQPPTADGPQGPHVDDFLTEEEVATLIGLVQDGTPHGGGSLWPAPSTINNNWWQGTWTDAHEEWFQRHLRELLGQRNEGPIRSRSEWITHFRRMDFETHGGQRRSRNG